MLLILYGKYWFGTTMTSLNVYLLSSRKVCWWITAIRRWSLLSKQHRQVREACCQSHQELLLVQGKTYLPFHSTRENHFRNSPLSCPRGGTLWDTNFLGNLLCSMLLKCYLRILEKNNWWIFIWTHLQVLLVSNISRKSPVGMPAINNELSLWQLDHGG